MFGSRGSSSGAGILTARVARPAAGGGRAFANGGTPMPEPHRLDYDSGTERPRGRTAATDVGFWILAVLNGIALACSGVFFALMVMSSNDRMGGLLGLVVGPPLLVVDVVLGAIAWAYVGSLEPHPGDRAVLRILRVLSTLPTALAVLGWVVNAIVSDTR